MREWVSMVGRRAELGFGVAACLWLLAFAPSASAAIPAFNQVPNSPFSTGASPEAVAYSPAGDLLATANNGGDHVAVFSVSPNGELTPVSGSPFATGSQPFGVAFSPSGGLLAVSNSGGASVSVFLVGAGGALTPAAGSPFGAGTSPRALEFSPDGKWLAVANFNGSTVSLYSVNNATGVLTAVSGSPFSTGSGTFPQGISFSPDSKFLATANHETDDITVFSVNSSTGALSAVTGSPFASGGIQPRSVAFTPNGNFLASANNLSGDVSVFSFNDTTGALTAVSGSPFAVAGGGGPESVAFNPHGNALGVAEEGVNKIDVFAFNSSTGAVTHQAGSPYSLGNAGEAAAATFSSQGFLGTVNDTADNVSVFAPVPRETITTPSSGATFAVGASVSTTFSCSDPFGTGVSSCTDSNGAASPSGTLDTSTAGPHVYAVTATNDVGQTSTTSVSYNVAAAPAVSIAAPLNGATYVQGQAAAAIYVCTDGAYGPGIASCSGTVANGALIATSTTGQHTFSVTAASSDGQTATQTVTYAVVPPPPVPPANANLSVGSVHARSMSRNCIVETGAGERDRGKPKRHVSCSKFRLTVRGSLLQTAAGSVLVQVSARVKGQLIVRSAQAQIQNGTFSAPLVLPGVSSDENPSRYAITVSYGGSQSVLAATASRSLRVEVEPRGR